MRVESQRNAPKLLPPSGDTVRGISPKLCFFSVGAPNRSPWNSHVVLYSEPLLLLPPETSQPYPEMQGRPRRHSLSENTTNYSDKMWLRATVVEGAFAVVGSAQERERAPGSPQVQATPTLDQVLAETVDDTGNPTIEFRKKEKEHRRVALRFLSQESSTARDLYILHLCLSPQIKAMNLLLQQNDVPRDHMSWSEMSHGNPEQSPSLLVAHIVLRRGSIPQCSC